MPETAGRVRAIHILALQTVARTKREGKSKDRSWRSGFSSIEELILCNENSSKALYTSNRSANIARLIESKNLC